MPEFSVWVRETRVIEYRATAATRAEVGEQDVDEWEEVDSNSKSWAIMDIERVQDEAEGYIRRESNNAE